MNVFRYRLQEALDNSRHSQQDLADYLGCHKTVVSSWVLGKAKLPNDIDRIIKIAHYLSVNPAWLAGFDEPIKKIKLTDAERELIEAFRELSEANQNLVVTTIRALPKEEKSREEKIA